MVSLVISFVIYLPGYWIFVLSLLFCTCLDEYRERFDISFLLTGLSLSQYSLASTQHGFHFETAHIFPENVYPLGISRLKSLCSIIRLIYVGPSLVGPVYLMLANVSYNCVVDSYYVLQFRLFLFFIPIMESYFSERFAKIKADLQSEADENAKRIESNILAFDNQ
jgi:hypothetical protein